MQLSSHTNLHPPQKAVFLIKARVYVSAQHEGGYAVMLLLPRAMEGINFYDVLDHLDQFINFPLNIISEVRGLY